MSENENSCVHCGGIVKLLRVCTLQITQVILTRDNKSFSIGVVEVVFIPRTHKSQSFILKGCLNGNRKCHREESILFKFSLIPAN